MAIAAASRCAAADQDERQRGAVTHQHSGSGGASSRSSGLPSGQPAERLDRVLWHHHLIEQLKQRHAEDAVSSASHHIGQDGPGADLQRGDYARRRLPLTAAAPPARRRRDGMPAGD